MKTYLVVTLACPDRPGIVEQVTEVIARYSANWEESRMARLGGDFAGIVKISVPEAKAKALADALQSLADDQMTVVVRVGKSAASSSQETSSLYELRLTGADHEGIVHKVAHYLAHQGINVETMETEVAPAPISASPLFRMMARIKAPPDQSLAELNAHLDRIGEELGVDIDVAPWQE